MATILTKRSNTASSVPVAGDLTNSTGGAELAVNTADKRLFTKDSGGTVVELGTNPSSITLASGTANAVPYLNGSKVLTSGSALTFDGTLFSSTVADNTIAVKFKAASSNIRFIPQDGGAAKIAALNGAESAWYPLVMQASNHQWVIDTSEQMRLTSTGLGIGTSSPGAKLEVAGGGIAIANSQQLLWRTSGGALAQILKLNSSNNVEFGDSQTSSQAMVLASGNLGLGVTPSAWGSGYKAFEVNGGAFWSYNANECDVYQNCYFNGTSNIYKTSAAASRYEQNNGRHAWYTAPSGTAGNAISFTQAMTLDASGNLLVGATSAGQAITVSRGSGLAAYIQLSGNGSADPLLVGSDASGLPRIYTGGSNPITFWTDNLERARIDSSGNLLVGTTTATGGGCQTNAPNGWGVARYLTDQSGRRNWAISTESLNAGDICLVASTANNTAPNTVRFQVRSDGSTFNSTGTYGTISDAKLKENIVDTAPKLADLLQVRVVNYNRIGEQRKELGVIAQELEQIFPGMIDEQEDLVDGQPTGTTTKAVKYSVFVPMLIKAIQEQQAIINQLKARLDAANL